MLQKQPRVRVDREISIEKETKNLKKKKKKEEKRKWNKENQSKNQTFGTEYGAVSPSIERTASQS